MLPKPNAPDCPAANGPVSSPLKTGYWQFAQVFWQFQWRPDLDQPRGAGEQFSLMKLLPVLCAFIAASTRLACAQTPQDTELAYTRTITERADKIIPTLDITNAARAAVVRDIIVQQYRDLRSIHDPRDAAIKAAKAKSTEDKSAAEAAVKAAQDEARVKLDKLHAEFLSKLSAQLSPEQVDKVKDGLTYGVVQVTYKVYVEKYRNLSEEQKAQIKSWLVEAREIAMDGSTSDEKHAAFGKYKGRINNYLSKAGYDLKTGELIPKK
jgi:Spy/CpxP family protein refolding chaperone